MSSGFEAPTMPLDVELFVSPACPRCKSAWEALNGAVQGLPAGAVRWERRDVVECVDRAVELGVRATPALAVSGKLLAVKWDQTSLRAALHAQLSGEH